ncbi:Hsp70 family protein [Dactylosporangium cerinum]
MTSIGCDRDVDRARSLLDFGTSHTVAVLARADGRVEPLLFDASPLLSSAVFAGADGRLLVGRDADRSARADPARYEPNPKRRLDEGTLLLGEAEIGVVDACAAVLRRVREEAARTLGGSAPARTVLTCPAGWGPQRRGVLSAAASAAGLTGVELVSEPVAAAAYFTTVLGHQVRHGDAIVVYDFGGGTFDVSVVRRTGDDAWDVAAADGLDVGGVDLDAAVVDWARRTVRPDDPTWQRLLAPQSPADRRHRRHLWDDARAAKEQLSRGTTADLAVPVLDVDAHLTRSEYEAFAQPWLERTVRLTRDTIAASRISADRLTGVFLVGGASRTPLVATMLHRALRLAPVVIEQPELVVAHGGLVTLTGSPPTSPLTVPLTPPVTEPVTRPMTQPPATPSTPPPSSTVPPPTPPPAVDPQPDRPAPPEAFSGAGFKEIMDEFFGTAKTDAPLRPGRNHETDVVLTKAQVREGVVVLNMNWPTLCVPCKGTGVAGGLVRGATCATCRGSGLTGALGRRTLKVRLPAGIGDRQRVRLSGRAHPSPDPGGPAGDLFVRVLIDPHEGFQRQGDDYLYTLDVTREQARSGAVVTVPTTTGTVEIRLPKDIPDGRTMRIPGRGARPDGALLLTIRIR